MIDGHHLQIKPGLMAGYSGCRSCNTRGVFPAPSSRHQLFGVWSLPKGLPRWNKTIIECHASGSHDFPAAT